MEILVNSVQLINPFIFFMKEVKIMFEFHCRFSVNGKMTEQTVHARNVLEAKSLIEAQYSNAKILWYGSPQRK